MPIVAHRLALESLHERLFLSPSVARRSACGFVGVRESTRGQVVNGALSRQRDSLFADLRELCVEVRGCIGDDRAQCGKLSAGRPDLERGFWWCRRLDVSFWWRSLPRFLRAEECDPIKNPFAEPTADELAEVIDMARGVRVVLLEPPSTPAQEVHRRAIIRQTRRALLEGRKPGREPLAEKLPPRILELILDLHWQGFSPGHVENILRRSYSKFRPSERAIRRFLKSVDPNLCPVSKPE